MSQVNPAMFSTMNLKTELEPGQGGAAGGDGAQYLSRVLKKPALEKPTEIWRTYLRRYDSRSDSGHPLSENPSREVENPPKRNRC